MPSTNGEVTRKVRRTRGKEPVVKELKCAFCQSTNVEQKTLTCRECGTAASTGGSLPNRFGRNRPV